MADVEFRVWPLKGNETTVTAEKVTATEGVLRFERADGSLAAVIPVANVMMIRPEADSPPKRKGKR